MGERKWGGRREQGKRSLHRGEEETLGLDKCGGRGRQERLGDEMRKEPLAQDPSEDTPDTREARILARSFFLHCKLQPIFIERAGVKPYQFVTPSKAYLETPQTLTFQKRQKGGRFPSKLLSYNLRVQMIYIADARTLGLSPWAHTCRHILSSASLF